jgi:hypothetical protein
MRIPGAPFETGTIIGAEAISRPPCGGGSGWGVALRSPILRLAKEARKSMARPPLCPVNVAGSANGRLLEQPPVAGSEPVTPQGGTL